MRLSVLICFEGLKLQNVIIMFLFSKKHSYLLKPIINPDVNNYLKFLCAVQYLDSSLHFGGNFWRLPKLMFKYFLTIILL